MIIAEALSLGVLDGHNSGIGGCFALVHWADGTVQAFDGREIASNEKADVRTDEEIKRS